jgi:beta-glucosidase
VIVELYLGDPHSTIDRPVRELKAFSRVELAPGESKLVTLTFDRHALSFWSPTQHTWLAEPGQFTLAVGPSSRTLPLTATFTLDK